MMQASEGKSKVAFRNLPKLCSFWLNGTCTRVLRKTCPFRPCCGTYLFPEIAGSAATKKLSDQLIEALNKDGPAAVQKSIDAETKSAIQQALKGNRDDAIRKRVSGEDDLSKKYLGRMKAMHLELDPPEDQSIVTLWLGNIDEDISDSDIREVIYPFGYIVNLVLVRSGRCAFVEYADRATAEHAAKQMYNSLTIKGYPISVNWAKPRAIALGGEYDLTVPESSSLQLPPGMNRPPQPDSLPPQLMAFIPQDNKRQRLYEGDGRPAPPTAPPPVVQPASKIYPSMNPSRMGAVL